MTPQGDMEAVLEAILFVATEPIPRERLLAVFDEAEREAGAAALDAVMARHAAAEGRGVLLEEVAGGLRLVTRPELSGWLKRFFEAGSGNKLSMAALETLAIIAYRQPITGPEIQDLRGVSPAGVLKTLLERRLVRISGRKEVVGKPFLYGTTREFLVHFGLKSLQDLPPLEEFEEALGEAEVGSGPAPAAGPGADREETIARETAEIEAIAEEREERAAEDADAPAGGR